MPFGNFNKLFDIAMYRNVDKLDRYTGYFLLLSLCSYNFTMYSMTQI